MKRGFIREDGMVFIMKAPKLKSGEWWVTPEHYSRIIANEKDKTRVVIPRLSVEEKLLPKIDICEPTSCWNWKGAMMPQGYGAFHYKGRNMYSSRASWLFFNKKDEVPKGFLILHKCDNRKCCNPDHLYLGTHMQNMKDMTSRRRTNGPNRLLKFEQAQEIRALHKTNKYSIKELGGKFNVSSSVVNEIIKGRNYKYKNILEEANAK